MGILKTLWIKRTLKSKIRLTFSLLVSFSILFTGYLNYQAAGKAMETNALRMNEQSIEKSTQMFDEKLRKILLMVTSLMITGEFQSAVRDAALLREETYYTHMSNLQSMLAQMQFSEPLIQSVLIVTPIGDFYSYKEHRRPIDFKDTSLFHRIEAEHRFIWAEGHEDQLFSGNHRVISFVMGLNTDVAVHGGYIVVNIDERGLSNFLHANTDREGDQFLVVSSDGELAIASSSPHLRLIDNERLRRTLDTASASHQSMEIEHLNKTYLINISSLETIKTWRFIGIQSKSELLKHLERMKWTTFLLVAICLLLALFASNVLTSFLVKPLQRLQKLMKQVESKSDLTVRYAIGEENDEFSRLGNRFNGMISEIDRLIQDMKLAESEKRKAEMKALTAQIDPHFFYNTLNTIYWKCELGKWEDVKRMILSFSRLFEIGLNRGEDMTTLDMEVTHVRLYLELQKYSYDQLFDYTIDRDPALDPSYPMLKLIVQPLAENSILHGFKEMGSNGHITIRLYKQQEQLVIEVSDNGAGMNAELVLNEALDNTRRKKSYALHNVIRRLRLYYSEQVQIRMSSIPHLKTTVVIAIPYQERKEALDE